MIKFFDKIMERVNEGSRVDVYMEFQNVSDNMNISKRKAYGTNCTMAVWI